MDTIRPGERHEAHAEGTWAAFLKDLRRIGNLSHDDAERAAVAVLHSIEQRIADPQARHLEAQLPSKLRDLLRAAGARPFARFGRHGLMHLVANELKLEQFRVEPIVRAVFAAIRMHISAGEADDLAAALPPDLAELWRHPGRL